MRKLLLRCNLSLGDIVMLTAAVRDLHLNYPGQFLTGVRSHFPTLWANNPYVAQLDERDADVESIDCAYPLINQCNRLPYHCLHGFSQFLSDRLGLKITPTAFRGDIHISDLEKSWMSQIHELTNEDTPFWILDAGGKFDVTIKWWSAKRYQEIIDYFRGKIQFVQVGATGHYHPKLEGVIDLRGKTKIRQLVRLVYHAQGVLCPVTSLMHLAAAIEFKDNKHIRRPCVVIAGAREPAHWEAYPNHQFIHTNGMLPCAERGGCWKARVVPLHDGDERDKNLCLNVTDEQLPRCMDLITAEDVIRRIELYFKGGAMEYLTPEQAKAAETVVIKQAQERPEAEMLNPLTALPKAHEFIHSIKPYPKSYEGRGIVICAGGRKYLTTAWVCINMLRDLKCQLPIQVWYLGEKEMDPHMRDLLSGQGVECVDGLEIRKKNPARILQGWQLKCYAVLHSPFKEVLSLDADNVPVVEPSFLFDTPEFTQTGAIFWPDYGRLAPTRSIWKFCGVPYQDEPEFESGQMVYDKERTWRALCLAMWYNEHSDFFYHYIHGDKDTFHMAFRKLNVPYAMPQRPIERLPGVMCQHDFQGRRIFQHRNLAKWQFNGANKRIPGFLFEERCLDFLAELERSWPLAKASGTS